MVKRDFTIPRSIVNFSKPKRLTFTKVGHRGLTTTQKNKLKKARGYRCEVCKKKFNPAFLDIDHKKGIHTFSKGKIPDEVGAKISFGKRARMKYDSPKNLQVICKLCHKKKNKKESQKRAKKRRKNPLMDIMRS